MKSNTCRFAERELSILYKSSTDPENRPLIEPFSKEILALCDRFGKSGQSGGSAPMTATAISQAIKKLLLQEPIMPMTGIDEEWVNVSEYGNGKDEKECVYQNRRCGGLFKNAEGKCWYLDAIVWKTQTGSTWSGSAILVGSEINEHGLRNTEKYRSRQYVKSFPFTPKTFYIDVTEVEEKKDDWTFYIKSKKQLDKVFKYYDRYL